MSRYHFYPEKYPQGSRCRQCSFLTWVEISLSTFSTVNMFIYYTVCIMYPTSIFKVYFSQLKDFSVCACLSVCPCICDACVSHAHRQRADNQFPELVLPPWMSSKDQSQHTRFAGQHFGPLSHLTLLTNVLTLKFLMYELKELLAILSIKMLDYISQNKIEIFFKMNCGTGEMAQLLLRLSSVLFAPMAAHSHL